MTGKAIQLPTQPNNWLQRGALGAATGARSITSSAKRVAVRLGASGGRESRARQLSAQSVGLREVLSSLCGLRPL